MHLVIRTIYTEALIPGIKDFRILSPSGIVVSDFAPFYYNSLVSIEDTSATFRNFPDYFLSQERFSKAVSPQLL